MCGIVGYIGRRDAVPVLLEGLRSLEYRGYDSAGLAVIYRNKLQVTKTAGRVQDLRDRVSDRTKATIGIGHTRWATHGEPNDTNAHPHTDTDGRIAVVHNGIIENAEQLRDALSDRGVKLASDTDTEALAHMIAAEAVGDTPLEEAVRATLRHVEGTYGLVVLDTRHPDELVVARNGSPIVLGIGEAEMFVASDVAALVRYTKQVVYLDDAEVATVHATDYRVVPLDGSGRRAADASKVPTTVEAEAGDYELGPYEDFMLKEIHEQPEALRRALRGRLDERFATAKLGGINLDARELRSIRQVKFLGCGSAYYAGQMGAVLIEELARIPSDAEPASEFRYRNPVVDPDTLYVAVSQSGETLDTLMAVQELRRKGGQVIGAVNVVGSAIGRECGRGVFLHAGPEIAVASTKALTNMAASFAMLALLLGRVRDLSAASGQRIVAGLRALPGQIEQILAQRRRDRRGRPPVRRRRAHVLHRPRPRLAGGPRGGAEAQGGLLRPRRGLPGGRAEARPARPDQLLDAQPGRGARRRAAVQEHLHHRADQGPWRPRHRGHQRRPAHLPGRRGHPRPERRARARPPAPQRPAPAPRLPRSRQARPRHRQAPQPGQERHGGITGSVEGFPGL